MLYILGAWNIASIQAIAYNHDISIQQSKSTNTYHNKQITIF